MTEASPLEQPSGITARSLVTRIGTAALYAGAVLGVLWWGAIPTAVLFGAMGALAVREFYAIQLHVARLPGQLIGMAATFVLPVVVALWGTPAALWAISALVVVSLLWHTSVARTAASGTSETVFGVLYVGFLLSYLVAIRLFDAGLWLALALVASVWASDVGAYFVGSLFGRHKLAPTISPKKSWEGFIAGVIACVTVWTLASLVPGTGISLVVAVSTGLGVALAATVGDLVESQMKREAGVKDSGTSLPGHGGFLDRLDSLILTAVVAYWILVWGGVS